MYQVLAVNLSVRWTALVLFYIKHMTTVSDILVVRETVKTVLVRGGS